jgi:hypothetical protein
MSCGHPEFHCMDCGVDTWDTDEFYMVADALWLSVVPDGRGMLCVGCLERRLGRRLTAADLLPRKMDKHYYQPEGGPVGDLEAA